MSLFGAVRNFLSRNGETQPESPMDTRGAADIGRLETPGERLSESPEDVFERHAERFARIFPNNELTVKVPLRGTSPIEQLELDLPPELVPHLEISRDPTRVYEYLRSREDSERGNLPPDEIDFPRARVEGEPGGIIILLKGPDTSGEQSSITVESVYVAPYQRSERSEFVNPGAKLDDRCYVPQWEEDERTEGFQEAARKICDQLNRGLVGDFVPIGSDGLCSFSGERGIGTGKGRQFVTMTGLQGRDGLNWSDY